MARTKSRLKKASAKVIHRGKKLAVVQLTMKPMSTTKRHVESRSYMVVPLTKGTLLRQVYGKAGRKVTILKASVRLKPFVPYERKAGRGVDHELVNTGKTTITLLKIYSR